MSILRRLNGQTLASKVEFTSERSCSFRKYF